MVDWISLSQTAGTGNATITVSASSYSELLDRSTSLVVSGGVASATVNLIQKFDTSFMLSPSAINNLSADATSESDYRNLTVTSDYPWSIVSKPEWVIVSSSSGSGSTTITVTATDNTGDTRTGTIVFGNENGLRRSVTVQQNTYASYFNQYLTFIMQEDGDVRYGGSVGAGDRCRYTEIEYSLNDGPWTRLSSYETSHAYSGQSFAVKSGDVIRFRGDNESYSVFDDGLGVVSSVYRNIGGLYSPSRHITCGNIMSMISSTNFTGVTGFTRTHVFGGMTYDYNSFFYADNVTSAKNLILPVLTLTEACYSSLFRLCTQLIYPPALPATTLAKDCYSWMFQGCTGLTTTPALPATTLAEECYQGMYAGCTSLTAVTTPSATALTDGCYSYMFAGCTALTDASRLVAYTAATDCYQYMFSGCTSLFYPPEINIRTLADGCFRGMFIDCTSLTVNIPDLPVETLAASCYTAMFSGCTGMTVAPSLPATALTESCYEEMFSRCISLTTPPVLSALTVAKRCCYKMFWECESLTAAPDLLATDYSTIYSQRCYEQMFVNCNNLSYVKCLAYYPYANLYGAQRLQDWLAGVAEEGTFVKHPNATWESGDGGIPYGWTIVNAT